MSTKFRAVTVSFPDAVAIAESVLLSNFSLDPGGNHTPETSLRTVWRCGRSFGASRTSVKNCSVGKVFYSKTVTLNLHSEIRVYAPAINSYCI